MTCETCNDDHTCPVCHGSGHAPSRRRLRSALPGFLRLQISAIDGSPRGPVADEIGWFKREPCPACDASGVCPTCGTPALV